MYQRWKNVDHPSKKLNAVAELIPAKQEIIIPIWAKPIVCKIKPIKIKLEKKSSEKTIKFQFSTVKIIIKSLPKRPKPPAINPSCIAR